MSQTLSTEKASQRSIMLPRQVSHPAISLQLCSAVFTASLTWRHAGKATCIAALLDHGAAHQVQTALNPTAVTPMLLAASFGHDDCVRLLSLHNPAGMYQSNAVLTLSFPPPAAVHACDANGVSPLMMAAAHASVPAVEALLQAGARQSAVDAFGRRQTSKPYPFHINSTRHL